MCWGSLVNETTFTVLASSDGLMTAMPHSCLTKVQGRRTEQAVRHVRARSRSRHRVRQTAEYLDFIATPTSMKKSTKKYKQTSGRHKDSLLPVPEPSGDQRQLHSTLCWHNGADGRCRQGSHGGSG